MRLNMFNIGKRRLVDIVLKIIVILNLLQMPLGLSGQVLQHQSTSCGHTVKALHHETFYHVQLEPEHVIRKREATQPLRFHLHFDQSLRDHLPVSHQRLVEDNVKKAVTFWSKTLRVRATEKPIQLRRQCLTNQVRWNGKVPYCVDGCNLTTVCGDIVIPWQHLEGCLEYSSFTRNFIHHPAVSRGVRDTDFVLYVATIPSEKCRENQTIAYAAHCQQEDGLDRPVAGYFSICPNSISTSRQNQQQLLSTMKHEILHALGFTAGLYAFYRDDHGNPRTPRNPSTGRPFLGSNGIYQWSSSVIREVVRSNWIQKSGVTERRVLIMVTPRVRDEVRRHFNCSTLEGAELEDQGLDGTALTHWEKRVFENEAMTGTYTQNSVISRITLAMMEDTGWYKADYSQAGDYEWGKNLGCEFAQNSCYNWIRKQQERGMSIHPFCDQVKRGELWTHCAHNRHSVALCNLIEYQNNMPARYQYFDTIPGIPKHAVGKYAGSVQLADYCPYLQEFSWTDDANKPVRGSNCQDSQNNLATDSNFFGEQYGHNSLCFEHASRWYLHMCDSLKSPQHAGSGCYKYSCDKHQGLSIQVLNYTHQCYHEKQVINIVFPTEDYLHRGTLVCPKCRDICGDEDCPPDQPAPAASAPRFKDVPCNKNFSIMPSSSSSSIVLPIFFVSLSSLTLLK